MPKTPAEDTPGSTESPYGPASVAPKSAPPKSSTSKTAAAKTASSQASAAKPATSRNAASKPAVPVPPIVPAASLPLPPSPVAVTPLPAPPAPYGAAPSTPYGVGPAKPQTTLSLLSMIFGIVGLALSCCYGGGGLFAAAGVVLGHIARRKREPAQGMSLTGLVTGYIGVSISLGWLIFAIVIMVIGITSAVQYGTYGY